MNTRTIVMYSLFIETIGVMLLSGGIVYEITFKADIGYIVMTMGALLTALGAGLFAKANPIAKLCSQDGL
jgi:hypothetical protein